MINRLKVFVGKNKVNPRYADQRTGVSGLTFVKMPKSVAEGFDTFLTRLCPLPGEHAKATSHKSSVERCLMNKFECSSFFETGSFGNSTGVRHRSDTDYFAVIPSRRLSDNSATSLRVIKEGLQGTFWSTPDIIVNTPAVCIPFGTYRSEDMEITPCCFNGLIRNFRSYHIANGAGGWMVSSPDAHNKYVREQDIRLNYKLKPLIRLIKAWKYYKSVPIRSFYLELYVTRFAEKESSIVYAMDIDSVLSRLLKEGLPDIIDPMGISGLIEPCDTIAKWSDAYSKLSTAVSRSNKAREAEGKGNIDNAFYYWDLLFDGKFPYR
jgi:hypothetical protein